MTISDTGYGCWKPYASSLDFKKLDFSKIKAVVELSEIGMADKTNDNKITRTLYAHYERQVSDSSKHYTQSIIDEVTRISQTISIEQSMGFAVKSANSSDLPGISDTFCKII